jgi:hypothetical protein
VDAQADRRQRPRHRGLVLERQPSAPGQQRAPPEPYLLGRRARAARRRGRQGDPLGADAATEASNVLTPDRDAPRQRREQAGQRAQDGRLAPPGRTEQVADPTRPELDLDAGADRARGAAEPAVADRQAARDENGLGQEAASARAGRRGRMK